MTINSVKSSTLLESGLFPTWKSPSRESPLNSTTGGYSCSMSVIPIAGDRVLCQDERNAVYATPDLL